MGTFSFNYSDRSTHQRPEVRAQIAENRKRFHCNLFEFWRQCRLPKCWQGHRCLGNPFDCFSRHHAAMPRDHAAWLHADILSRTTGTATAERALGAFGLSMPDKIEPECIGPSPSCEDGEAVTTAPAHDDDASRRARSAAEILSELPSEMIADLEKTLGTLLASEVRPEPAGPPARPKPLPRGEGPCPSPQADAEARAAVSEQTSPASPGTTCAEPTSPAADPPPPVEWRWTGPLNPPQAYCDEEGRLIIPDRTEYNERVRRGMTWTEANKA